MLLSFEKRYTLETLKGIVTKKMGPSAYKNIQNAAFYSMYLNVFLSSQFKNFNTSFKLFTV